MKREKSLRRMIVPLILLSAAIPLVALSALSIINLSNTMKIRYQKEVEESLKQSEKLIDLALDKYEILLYELCTDEEFISQAVEMENGNLPEEQKNRMLEVFGHICNRTAGVEGMSFFTPDGTLMFYDRRAASSTQSNWIKPGFLPSKQKEMVAYHADARAVETKGGSMNLFHITRKLVDISHENRVVGTVVMSLNTDVLKKTISQKEGTKMYISEDGRIICSFWKEDIGEDLQELNGSNYYVKSIQQKETGWEITEFYALDLYWKMVLDQVLFELLIAAAMMVILMIVAELVAKRLLHPVDRIVNAMSQVQEGDFRIRLDEGKGKYYEVNRISDGFNKMVEQIDRLIQQVREAAEEQKNAELQALEAQIDPHFLYNTLDTINWKAIEKEDMEISEMVGDLADILRYTVINAGGPSSIRDELYWLRQYVRLQQERIGKEVLVEVEASEAVQNVRIHKLLLQPFVENSIKYGFRNQEGECRIDICITREKELVHICLRDNGKGMDTDMLKKLQEECDVEGHVGIQNVRKRLKLYYSDRASLNLESEKGKFTQVDLYIPEEGKE